MCHIWESFSDTPLPPPCTLPPPFHPPPSRKMTFVLCYHPLNVHNLTVSLPPPSPLPITTHHTYKHMDLDSLSKLSYQRAYNMSCMTYALEVILSWLYILFWHLDCIKYLTVCRWFLGWFLFVILSLSAPSSMNPSPPDKVRRIGEYYWALNNSGFHPVSSEPPLINTRCRDFTEWPIWTGFCPL